MYKNYNKIFWGLIVSMININLGPINLLPNFLGFIIILLALDNLFKETNNKKFKKAKYMSTLLMLISLVTAISGFMGIDFLDQKYSILAVFANLSLNFIFRIWILQAALDELKELPSGEPYYNISLRERNYIIGNLIAILLIGLGSIWLIENLILSSIIFGIIIELYFIFTIREIRELY